MTKRKKTEPQHQTPENTAVTEFDAADAEAGIPQNVANNPELARYYVAKKIAHMLAGSRMVPEAFRGRPADCFIAMQMGHELGMNPFMSIQSIAVIDGRPCVWGDALIGCVRASPKCKWIAEKYDPETQVATCTTQRDGDPEPITRMFSWEMATIAGLINKDVWRKYGTRMLQMRARGWCLRDAYPDVLKGLRVAEEVMDYSSEPAPITAFALPAKTNAEATAVATNGAGDEPVTLLTVLKAFEEAKTMEELLAASKMTQRLSDEGDIKKARTGYKARRDMLQPPAVTGKASESGEVK